MRCLISLCLFVVLALPAFALSLGDKAPPLTAASWLNGTPVDPSKPDGTTVYVVEFWATWCPPCRKSIPKLNQLHSRLASNNVVIVGVSMEDASDVTPFVKKMNMAYRVAIDSEQTMAETYMKGVSGIPHAFIIDTNGVVAWAGHPMADMEEALDQILAGSYDISRSPEEQTMEGKLQELLAAGEFEKALRHLDRLIIEDKTNFGYYELKLGLLAQTEDYDAMKKVYAEIVERFADSEDNLNTVAWIASTSPFPMCDLEIAWNAARRAATISERKSSAILDTLARVHYALGLLQEAIRIQEEAVNTASSEDEKAELGITLDYYRSALRIRTQALSNVEGKL